MKNSRSIFTNTALSILLVVGIQHSDFGQSEAKVAATNFQEPASSSFAIRVNNYQETIQWYRDNLHATVEGEWTVPNNPQAKLTYLNIYGFRLKVLSDGQLPTNTAKYQIKTSGLNRQISLQVKDLAAVINRLNKQGVNTLVEFIDRPLEGEKVAFIEDNNGNVIEFLQSI